MARAWAEMSGGDTPRVEEARALLALQNGLNGDEGFTVPVNINGRITDLNVYVVNGKALHEDGARIYLSLHTEGLGTVQGYFTINNGIINADFSTGTAQALHALENEKDTLAFLLAEAGLSIGEWSFTVNAPESPTQDILPQPPATPAEARESAHEYKI
jgi:hypothetical protein